MWHVSSRSGVATLRTAIHLLTYLLSFRSVGASRLYFVLIGCREAGTVLDFLHTGACSVDFFQASFMFSCRRRRKAWVQIAVAALLSNSLRQTVHTHRASVHQAAKLIAALLRVARVTAGLAESNGSLPLGL